MPRPAAVRRSSKEPRRDAAAAHTQRGTAWRCALRRGRCGVAEERRGAEAPDLEQKSLLRRDIRWKGSESYGKGDVCLVKEVGGKGAVAARGGRGQRCGPAPRLSASACSGTCSGVLQIGGVSELPGAPSAPIGKNGGAAVGTGPLSLRTADEDDDETKQVGSRRFQCSRREVARRGPPTGCGRDPYALAGIGWMMALRVASTRRVQPVHGVCCEVRRRGCMSPEVGRASRTNVLADPDI